MADMTSQDIQAMIDKLDALPGNLAKALGQAQAKTTKPSPTSTAGKQDKADKESLKLSDRLNKSHDKYEKTISKMDRHFGAIDREVGKLTGHLSDLGKLFSAAGVVGMMSKNIGQTIDRYRELNKVGQTFQGSLLDMQIAAAEARVPLEEFTKMVTQSSTVIAAIGVKSFTQLGVTLRQNLRQFGELGMTTSELNDFVGEYMKTQEAYGNLTKFSSESAGRAMKSLAIETQKVSELTGKNKDQLQKTAMEALRDNSLRSKMFLMTADASERLQGSLNKATVYLAGLPGDAGDLMSKMLAQSVGRGSAMLTDSMQGFVNAGMFGVTDLVDNLRKKIETGTVSDEDMDRFRDNFVKMGKQNMTSLKYLADFGNDPDAKKAIEMITSMANLDQKKLKELKEQQTATKFFLNLQSNIQMVSGFLRERFFKGLKGASEVFESWMQTPAFEKLKTKVGEIAERFGKWLANDVFSDKNMQSLGDDVAKWADRFVAAGQWVWNFGKTVGDVASSLAPVFTTLGAVMSPVIDGLKWFADMIGAGFKKLNDTIGPLATGILAATAALTGFLAFKAIKGRLAESFHIGGNTVGQLSPRNFTRDGAMRVHVVNQGGGTGGSNMEAPERERRHSRGTIQNAHKPHPMAGRSRVARWSYNAGHAAGRGVSHVRTAGSRIGGAVKSGGRSMARIARSGGSMLSKGAGAVGKGVKALGVGGIAGLAGGLAIDMGLQYANSKGDFAGKGALNLLGGAASGALTGASIGSIIPGIGTAVGAAIGGVVGGAMSLVEHWDDVTKDAKSAVRGIGKAVDLVTASFKSTWNGLKSGFANAVDSVKTGYSMAIDAAKQQGGIVGLAAQAVDTYVNSVKRFWGDVAKGDFADIGKMFTEGSSWMVKQFDALTSAVSGWWNGIKTWANEKLGPRSDFGKALSGIDMANAMTGMIDMPSSAPTEKPVASIPVINTDDMQNQIKALQDQNKVMSQENASLKSQIAQMNDTLAKILAVQQAGLGGLIDETKKGNRDLGSLTRGNI